MNCRKWQIWLIAFGLLLVIAPSVLSQRVSFARVEKLISIPVNVSASHVDLIQSDDGGFYALINCTKGADVDCRVLVRLNNRLKVEWYRLFIDSVLILRQHIIDDKHRGCYMVDVQRVDSRNSIRVVRFDASGTIVVDTVSDKWMSFASDIREWKDGGIIMAGGTTVVVTGGDGVVRRIDQNEILALDTNGCMIWKHIIPEVDSYKCSQIANNTDTRIYCVLRGNQNGSAVVRLDSNGHVYWTRSFLSHGISPAQIVIRNSDEILITTDQPYPVAKTGLAVSILDTNGELIRNFTLNTVLTYAACVDVLPYGIVVVERTGRLKIFDNQESEILNMQVENSPRFKVFTGDCIISNRELVVVNVASTTRRTKTIMLRFLRYRFQMKQ